MAIVYRLAMLAIVAVFPSAVFAQRARPTAPSDVFRNAKNSVVLIVGAGQEDIVQGSGFVQAPNRVVTNFHVIDGREKLVVKFADGNVVRVEDVVRADKNADLAILAVPTGARQALPLGDELVLHEGDNVLALGAPRGLQLTLTNGIVSSFRHDEHSFLIQTTAPIAPGSSGGPLLDSSGRVVGITTFRLSDSPGLYFSVAVSELKRLLRATSTKPVSLATSDEELDRLRKEINAGRVEAANNRASTLLSHDPENPKGLAIKGIVALQANRNNEAVKLLSMATSRDPESQVMQSYYSLALIYAGDFKRALIHAKKAEEIQQTELSEQALALSAYLLNDLPTAKKSAQKVLDGNEDNEFALEILTGVAYWSEPNAQTWIARAKDVKRVDPKGSWALILDWRESTPHDNNKLELAKSASFPNEMPYTILSYAHLLSTTADFRAAANDLKPALAAMPQNSRLLGTAIFIDLLNDDFSSAADHFSTLQDSTADPTQVHQAGCFYYLAVLKPRLAMQDCKAIVDSQPDNYTAHSNYGWAALDSNEFSLALQEFSTARKLSETTNLRLTSSIDLIWGLLLANWWSGNEAEAKRLHDSLVSSGGDKYTAVAELKKLPLLWSRTQLARIQGANDKWHK